MKETLESLQHKIGRARELAGVVRTMKALSAAAINQYEQSVQSLSDYYRIVEMGLYLCFIHAKQTHQPDTKTMAGTGALVFGSDQGLVGQFNDVLLNFTMAKLEDLPGGSTIWTVGEAMGARLADVGRAPVRQFSVPNSVEAITPLIAQLLLEIEQAMEKEKVSTFYLFYNRPQSGAAYQPVSQRFLPLDKNWLQGLTVTHWPTQKVPEIVYSMEKTTAALIREYLFVSLFRACAESLSSENASRLAAMQRAEKNIKELLNDLNLAYHQLRQNSIDEELFDVISGAEALGGED